MSDLDSRLQTRPSLLVRIRDAKDDDAWSSFVEIYAPVVYRYCRRKGLQHSDAADVTQDVLGQVARSATQFEYRPEQGRFRDWLGTVTHNRVANHFRSLARNQREMTGLGDMTQDPPAPQAPASEWVEEFNSQILKTALERVQPLFEVKTWQAFELLWIQNHAGAAAAKALELSIDSVYMAKSRVLKRLKEEVLSLAEDLPLSGALE
jgi:RNA polymerase sigma-70 factor (ECF subfamily)